MDLISTASILEGLSVLADPNVHLFLFIGAVVGMLFGAAPGLTAPAGVALLLPLTYDMGLQASLALLLGVYCSGYFAGSVPAILINTPGTPGNAASAIDGYEMAKQGHGNRAITAAVISSFVGGLVSMLLLMSIAPTLAQVALSFTSVEYFALALLGIVCVAGISEGSFIKGAVAALIGIFISTIGLDPISGVSRMTFGIPDLLGGVSIIPALIGLFAISEMLLKAKITKEHAPVLPTDEKAPIGSVILEHWRNKWLALKGAVIGSFVGLLPGTGPAIASWISYAEALRTAKPKDKYGKGEIKGVIACETSNNAVTGGAMVPLLTLGIPGDPVTAVLIGALMIQGIEPGPFFLRDFSGLFVAILFLLFLSNCWMVILGLSARRLGGRIVRIPASILVPVITVLAAAGSFATQSNAFDVMLVLIFGILGYFFVRFRFPVAAAVLGIVLGPILEVNLRNALIANNMDFTVFVTRPISAGILVLMVVLIFLLVRKGRLTPAQAVEFAPEHAGKR